MVDVVHTPRSFCSVVDWITVLELVARLNNVRICGITVLPRCITLHFVVLKFKSQSFEM